MKTKICSFNKFELEMPEAAIRAICHSGDCMADVICWESKINRPENLTPEILTETLKEYGAWDTEELADDAANWRRIIWIAAWNIFENEA